MKLGTLIFPAILLEVALCAFRCSDDDEPTKIMLTQPDRLLLEHQVGVECILFNENGAVVGRSEPGGWHSHPESGGWKGNYTHCETPLLDAGEYTLVGFNNDGASLSLQPASHLRRHTLTRGNHNPGYQSCGVKGTAKTLVLHESNATLAIKNTLYSGDLCTLVRVEEDGHTIPVGRSYDGMPWGRSGGNYASKLPDWTCAFSICRSKLPPGIYSLQSRTTTKPSAPSDVSRFLQTTTFGPTESEIDSFDVTYAHWLKNQMSIPPTSHREYFRSTMNTNWAFHKFQFSASLDVCGREYTSWRMSAFSLEDDAKDVNVTWRGALERWEIQIDGEIRSMPKDLRFVHRGNEALVSGQKYTVCTPWRYAVRGMVFVRAEGIGCHRLHPESFTPPRVLAETFEPVDDELEWNRLDPKLFDFIKQTNIPFGVCDGLDLGSPETVQPPIFARAGTRWLLYNPRIIMDSNSILAPSADGGLAKMSRNEIVSCSNVRRNPFNEVSCRMSQDRACQPGSTAASNQQWRQVICGSHGEVANNPLSPDNWFTVRAIDGPKSRATNLPLDAYSERSKPQKSYVWNTVALEANDQLRQRVAWALLQVFALPGSSIGQTEFTEPFLNYYDILVRNSFTNYGDLLREIAYNPLQAISLSFLGSVSLGYHFDKEGTIQYPDENFAREILQLFSIGLLELNDDGTVVLDEKNKPIQTYGTADILELARAWTGFNLQPARSNIETYGKNLVDPMRLEHFKRDRFPKSDLAKGFIGDKFPLCIDLPNRAYLMKGAKYVLLGELPATIYAYQHPSTNTGKKLVLSPGGSGLFEKLCGSNSVSTCNYPATVIVDETLSCEGSQESSECGDVDAIHTVQVGTMFYELSYGVPCVELAFFNNGIKVAGDEAMQQSHCANPGLAVASEACCDSSARATPLCRFSGEQMSMLAAQQRCASVGKSLCSYVSFQNNDPCTHKGSRWTVDTCKIKAKINGRGGVAIVHDTRAQTGSYVSGDSPNYFRVHWDDEMIPSTSSCPAGCVDLSETCLCDILVETSVVFSTFPQSKTDVLKSLHIGAMDPETTIGRNDLLKRDYNRNGYFVHTKEGTCCDASTVFEVRDENGRLFFLRNVKESVRILGTQFSFRNPPHFNRFHSDATSLAHAELETDATIDHILHHRNTAPFVSRHLIQRLGVSNPSPQYVFSVAKAFRTGKYSNTGTSFGTGRYGDMAATIAAVVLDPEVRSHAARADPSTGSLREPILKILHIMRSLGFKKAIPYVDLADTAESLGQEAYFQPSVFSFFSSDYSPPEVSKSSLVAPEAQITTFSKTVSMLNGVFSLLDRGLKGCEGGLGSLGCAGLDLPNTGSLTLQPANVWTLERLLTAGHLPSANLDFIRSLAALAPTPGEEWAVTAKLLASTPQFHSTNDGEDEFGPDRGQRSQGGSSRAGSTYRAVIHLALQGGCDSFNVLTPHPTCGTLYDQYKKVRGSIALNATLDLENRDSAQPCQRFGLHPSLPLLKELYDDGDLAFFANIGALADQVTVDNFEERTPFQLFAHNTLQEETSALDPLNDAIGTGALGRMSAVMDSLGYRTARTTLGSIPLSLQSASAKSEPILSVDYRGVDTVNFTDVMSVDAVGGIQYLNSNANGEMGPFGGFWSSTLKDALNQTEKISNILSKTTETAVEFGSTILDQQSKVISQLIRTRAERGVDRDFFFVDHGSFDHHADLTTGLELGLSRVNAAIRSLVTDLKDAGVWDEVILVQTSEFGRTLVPNTGGGTDHGWGGNSWMASGKIIGNQVLGQYPESLAVDSSLSIDERGRLVPTTPWESPLQAVAEHLGITEDSDLEVVLPNRGKFDNLFRKSDLFES